MVINQRRKCPRLHAQKAVGTGVDAIILMFVLPISWNFKVDRRAAAGLKFPEALWLSEQQR